MHEIDNLIFRTQINSTTSTNILHSAVLPQNNQINISTNTFSNIRPRPLRNVFNNYPEQSISTLSTLYFQMSLEPIINLPSEPTY